VRSSAGATGFLTAGGPAPKTFRAGTHRLISPAETVARLRHLLPVMGITRIANVTGLDTIGVPVVMVCRPNSRSLAVSQGKGLDLAAAKASGLMESIELYHAERIHQSLKWASYEELRYTHRLVPPGTLVRTSLSRFHRDLSLLWIEGRDLQDDEPIWLPYETVHTNYSAPLPPGSGCFASTSNGLASGNHLLEAISHGICEVVERDSTTLWERRDEAAQDRTRVDLATVDDEGCRAVLDKCERAGVDVVAWETTTDVGIPSFLCMITNRTQDPLRPLYSARGMGCHPARGVALLRALTEAVQGRTTYISGSRDDMYRAHYERSRSPDVLLAQRALIEIKAPTRRFQEAPTWESDTFQSDVAWELERLRSAGIPRAVVVDLTRSEFRIPVVRVVIPGLEGPAEKIPHYLPGPRARAILDAQPRGG
jgi:YcaO-like protein with predicted kinase domain